jgi:hypothetical protein
MNKTIGILAYVDAGKTTFAEQMNLYENKRCLNLKFNLHLRHLFVLYYFTYDTNKIKNIGNI